MYQRQKLGAARSVNLEVSQLVGVAEFTETFWQAREESGSSGGGFPIFGGAKKAAPPPPPPPPVRPEKITISANVQCVFGIER